MKYYCPECNKEVETSIIVREKKFNIRDNSIVQPVPVRVCTECGEELIDIELDDAILKYLYTKYNYREVKPYKMKVRDLEPILPTYDEGEGFDVAIIYEGGVGKKRYGLCPSALYRPKYNPEQRELTVVKVLAGVTKIGGHFDDTLQIVVEEPMEKPIRYFSEDDDE